MDSRIKFAQVKPLRALWMNHQKGRCAITHRTIPEGKDVLDHDHKTGRIRGVLSSSANSMLGVIENNYRRVGLTLPELFALCRGLEAYLSRDYSGNPIHPTFKSEDEKRIRRNTLARKRRAAKKESQ